MEEMNTSSQSLPPTLSSLPDDIILNCFSRISRFHYPTLSLVSKDFKSLIASPELEATRSSIGKTEDYLCVCLKVSNNNPNPNPNPCWFTISSIPKHKLKPLPSFPHQYPQSSTVVSIGSEIYMIGGFLKGKRSRQVFALDCRALQWRRLPKMRLPRASASGNVFDGKIVVIGGCRSKNIENLGEIYDPKTKTWKPITTKLGPSVQVSEASYNMNGSNILMKRNSCFVEIEKVVCLISIFNGSLFWRDLKEGLTWVRVKGLEELFSNHLISVANSGKGGRVTVWKKLVIAYLEPEHCTEECETEIWCAEISFERRGLSELWGLVEQFRKVLTVEGNDSTPGIFLHSTIVTY